MKIFNLIALILIFNTLILKTYASPARIDSIDKSISLKEKITMIANIILPKEVKDSLNIIQADCKTLTLAIKERKNNKLDYEPKHDILKTLWNTTTTKLEKIYKENCKT